MSTFVPMIPYENKSQRSGVRSYGFLEPKQTNGVRIMVIEFKDHNTYAFMRDLIGEFEFDTMAALAEQGEGLATFIAKNRPLGVKIVMDTRSPNNGFFPSKPG